MIGRRWLTGAWGSLLALAAPLAGGVGCASRVLHVHEPLRQLEVKKPVVLIPGITGSQLRRGDRRIWGGTGAFFTPRDSGYALARPLGVDGPAPDDDVEGFAVIETLRLAFLRIDVYDSLLRTLEANGYQRGHLEDPQPGDTLFVFNYDWRDGNVETARKLRHSLERLRLARGEDVLAVDLICQSDAARIARWYLKYGEASLAAAERGETLVSPRVRVDKLMLVGTATGGALGTLIDMHRGRRYVPWIGRKFRPEVLFTFPSLFEALPAYREDFFFDESGQALPVDLYDPDAWVRYGWSAFEPDVAKRLARPSRRARFGDDADRRAHLARLLDRARRLQDLLRRDVPGFGSTRYYQIQNTAEPTTDRALLLRRGDRWRIYFGEDRRVRKNPALAAVANAPGDTHATVVSQDWLSPQERTAVVTPKVEVPAPHRQIVVHPVAMRAVVEILSQGEP